MTGDGAPQTRSYRDLTRIADRLLATAGEDESILARLLLGLDPALRDELLVSDLLNAWQVFWFFFQTDPGDLARERLILEPASSLVHGVHLGDQDFIEVYFQLEGSDPVITLTDGEAPLARFEGSDAYSRAVSYINGA